MPLICLSLADSLTNYTAPCAPPCVARCIHPTGLPVRPGPLQGRPLLCAPSVLVSSCGLRQPVPRCGPGPSVRPAIRHQ